jgi:hypothetical protein
VQTLDRMASAAYAVEHLSEIRQQLPPIIEMEELVVCRLNSDL